MYGLISRINAVPGRCDELIRLLSEISDTMPGCLSYIVARDVEDANALWVTEVWVDADSHKAALQLPLVQQAIERGKGLMLGVEHRFETKPVAGLPGLV